MPGLPIPPARPILAGMPRWMFVLLAAALFLSVFGIVLTFIKTGPTQNQPTTSAPRSP